MRVIGNKLYDVCWGCGKIVQFNKRLFGSTHLCWLPEERTMYHDQLQQRIMYATRQLEALR